jgi:hypothetical protein
MRQAVHQSASQGILSDDEHDRDCRGRVFRGYRSGTARSQQNVGFNRCEFRCHDAEPLRLFIEKAIFYRDSAPFYVAEISEPLPHGLEIRPLFVCIPGVPQGRDPSYLGGLLCSGDLPQYDYTAAEQHDEVSPFDATLPRFA